MKKMPFFKGDYLRKQKEASSMFEALSQRGTQSIWGLNNTRKRILKFFLHEQLVIFTRKVCYPNKEYSFLDMSSPTLESGFMEELAISEAERSIH